MIIKNGIVLDESFNFRNLAVKFGENISDISEGFDDDTTVIDAKGSYVLPGLFDIHTHGAVGVDANSADNFEKWRGYMQKNGIINFFPTTVSASYESLEKAFSCLADKGADGINMEGPYINPDKKGAHDKGFIKNPNYSEFKKLNKEADNKIKLTTIAPELMGGMDFIENAVSDNIAVSLGHSASSYLTAVEAFKKGAISVTHIFNAMNSLLHREPGLIGAALDSKEVFCEVIADKIHLHESIIRILFKVLGEDRMVLVSDSMTATGLCDGTYTFANQTVFVKNKTAKTLDGTVSGSVFNLKDMVLSAASVGIPLEKTIKMASLTPARLVKFDKFTGSIKKGKQADIFIADKNLNVIHAFKKGVKVV